METNRTKTHASHQVPRGRDHSLDRIKNRRRQKQKRLLDQVTGSDARWMGPLAGLVAEHADVLAHYIACVIGLMAAKPLEFKTTDTLRWQMTRTLATLLFPQSESSLEKVEESLETLGLALGEFSTELLSDPSSTAKVLEPAIRFIARALESNPHLTVLLGHPEILSESFGHIGEQLAGVLALFPALSNRAAASLPNLKEIFFNALFQLSEEERAEMYGLAETILRETYRSQVFPRLKELLSSDPRGKVLTPLLSGAIEVIPGESCLNACLSMACTPREQLTTGRIIAIAIQELGGLYVKISQVIAELCPPSLARELRTSQDDAGGLFPSMEKSWNFLLEQFEQGDLKEWREHVRLPRTPQPHFASASVGALYELELSFEGKRLHKSQTVLIKLQRPGLANLLERQCDHLLRLCTEAQVALHDDVSLTKDLRGELLGITAALQRAVLNYFKQSKSELDFNQEQKNAERVRAALRPNTPIRIPHYFFTTQTTVIMERMAGTKVTKIVQSKYLERREIADNIARAYLDLVFEQGVVWADPHPGNLLFDDVTNQVSMIDLNPCFVWDQKTRENFKNLLYRLILRDAQGVYTTLYSLVESPETLHSNTIFDDLRKMLNAPESMGSLTRFVGELLRTLGENNVDLRIEVQAALRGLSQLALTATAISVRNGFGLLFRTHFGAKEMMSAAWDVGFLQVARVLSAIVFELTRQAPEEDVGPVLDERDLAALDKRVQELTRANVCDVHLVRVSPEDNSSLKISADGSLLLLTSNLKIEILEKRRPATVRYVIEIPTRKWLKERQEFVKLSSIARNFCIIECLEQLRRNSLDDYWRIVEAWSKPGSHRTVEETRLVGQVKTAARKLYALRFAGIWDTVLAGLPRSAQRVWKYLMTTESWREEAEQKYLTNARRKFGNVIFTSLAFSTFYRIKMILIECVIWTLRRRIKKLRFNMSLLPMTTGRLEDLILFSLSRNFNERR